MRIAVLLLLSSCGVGFSVVPNYDAGIRPDVKEAAVPALGNIPDAPLWCRSWCKSFGDDFACVQSEKDCILAGQLIDCSDAHCQKLTDWNNQCHIQRQSCNDNCVASCNNCNTNNCCNLTVSDCETACGVR